MCGFAAIFETGRLFDPALLNAIDRDLYHRGPDSGGQISEPGVGLVFRRLAIMDLGHGADQPMMDASKRYSMVFNGEIYNFRTLRSELAALGANFKTTSDTEVILQGYIHWGERIFERIEGMFAVVIWDRQERKVIAARDPLGIKPLYLLHTGNLTAFASEIRPLKRFIDARPDPKAISELLIFKFAAGRLSNIQGIDKLPGGTIVTLNMSENSLVERRFCDPLDTLKEDHALTEAEALEQASEAVKASVKAHLQSDVGYTVQLSGGVDSSLITALASRSTQGQLNTFGINLDPLPHDEGEYRKQVADRYNITHHEVKLSNHDYADALPRAIQHMEGPVAHSGCVLLMLLCDQISKYSKVTLTGEGADELFGGYMRYQQWEYLQRKGRYARIVPSFAWPMLQRYREIQRYSGRDAAIYGSVYGDFLATMDLFPDLVPEPGAREAAATRFQDFPSRMFAVDQSAYLESLLLRQDKLSMAASVEARVPFTHYPLFKLVNSFPHALRAPTGITKPILKKIAEPYLSDDLLYRRKVGLTLPLLDWFSEEKGLGRYLELLTDSDSRLASYCDKKMLRKVVNDFRQGKRHGLPPIENLVSIELWLRQI